MHYYDCPCDDCRSSENDTLHQRVLHVIERLEQELDQPRVTEYDRALDWLGAVCGGPDAVRGLDARPLLGPVVLPADPRMAEVAGLVSRVAAELFDAEAEVAFRRGLARVWEHDPGLVTAPVTAAYVAAGVVWAVGEANDLVGADRRVTSSRLKYALDTPGAPSTYARPIRRALQGLWPWRADEDAGSRVRLVRTCPTLSALGHVDLLTSRTRAQLIRVRDHALAARAEDRPAA